MPTTILIARHGETDWNREHRWQGHADPPLNEAGRRQALELAARLRATPPGAVYSSDLSRAQETAAIVAAAFGLELNVEPRLREVDVGEWSRPDLRAGRGALPGGPATLAGGRDGLDAGREPRRDAGADRGRARDDRRDPPRRAGARRQPRWGAESGLERRRAARRAAAPLSELRRGGAQPGVRPDQKDRLHLRVEDYTNKYKGEQVEVALFGGEYQDGVLTAYCYVDDVAHIELNGHILIPLQNIASLHCSSRCDAPEPDWPPQGLAEDEPDERDDEA